MVYLTFSMQVCIYKDYDKNSRKLFLSRMINISFSLDSTSITFDKFMF